MKNRGLKKISLQSSSSQNDYLNFSSKEVIEEEDGCYKKDFKPKSWTHALD
jgi:hypothetical protein